MSDKTKPNPMKNIKKDIPNHEATVEKKHKTYEPPKIEKLGDLENLTQCSDPSNPC